MAKISLPSIVSALPQDVRNFLQRVREALNGGQIITADDLVDSGLAEYGPGGSLLPTSPTELTVDYAPPPAPTNVTASGALETIMLQWDDPAYANFAHAEIWRSAIDDFGTATLLGLTGTVLYPDAVPAGSTYYYWVRFVSQAAVNGPYQGLSGVLGQTSADPDAIINILTENSLFQPGPFYYQATATVINGVTVPAGTYLTNAYIAHGSIGALQVGHAAIDTAHVRELAVNKLTSGTITGQEITIGVGGNIKSGQTAFNTGSGWFLGKGVDGYSRFSVGSPTGAGLDYDQSTGAMRFRGIMELSSGSTIGGISADSIGGWARRDHLRWDFTYPDGSYGTGQLSGWYSANGTMNVSAGKMILYGSASNVYLYRQDLSVPGSDATIIRMSIKRLGGSSWTGNVHFGNNAGYSGLIANIPEPVPFEIGDTAIVEWDMTNLVLYDPNSTQFQWVGATVSKLQLTLGGTISGINDVFEIDWITIENTNPQIDGVNIHADSSILTGSVTPQAGSKYSVLSGGEIEFFDYYSGGFHLYKSLKHIVTGTCQDGVQVNLGYFRSAPKVIISPKSLMAYRGAYSSQDQTFVLEANNILQSGDNWYFTPKAQLQLSANYGTFGQQYEAVGYLPYGYSSTSVDVYTGQVNFPANCRSVSVSVRIGRSFYEIIAGGYPNYQSTTYKATVTATVYIQYYSYGTWISGQYAVIGNDGSYPRYYTYSTVDLTASSGADIQAVRVYVNFTKGGNVYDPWSYWNPTPSASINTEAVCIMAGSYSLTSAVISLTGWANYMAIG